VPAIVIAEVVVQVSVYCVRVVVSAAVPVTVQKSAPEVLLMNSFARGNITPAVAVFFIHSV